MMSEKKNSEKHRLVNELHAPARRNFPRRRVIIWRYDGLWQADLVEMRLYTRAIQQRLPIHSHHYWCAEQYAWAVPLKTKSGNDVAIVIAKIILDDKRCPKNLQTDRGKEFYNANVQKLMKKHGINYYSTYSVMKASVQPYVEEWYVETVYSQWKLQMDWFVITSCIRVQRAKALDNRYETYWRNSRDHRQTLNDGV